MRVNALPRGLERNWEACVFARVDRKGLPEKETLEKKSELNEGVSM